MGLLLELPLSSAGDNDGAATASGNAPAGGKQGKKMGAQQGGAGDRPAAAAGYVHISNVSDERVDKLEKVFG